MIAIILATLVLKNTDPCSAAKTSCENECAEASHENECNESCEEGYSHCLKVPYRSQCKTFQNYCEEDCQYDECEDACAYGARACWLEQENQ